MGDADPRSQVLDLAHALRTLHKTLVAVVQVQFEKQHGRVAGPGALLQLLLQDPSFAWLRPLSTLIADLDELVDDREIPVEASTVAGLRRAVEKLTTDTGDASGFAVHYLPLLQTHPDVVMEHAAVRRQLSRSRS